MRKIFFGTFFILTFILASCKKDNNTQSTISPVSDLTLSKSSLTLFLGYADTLYTRNQQSSTMISWTTSNDSVATVTDGRILAVGKGTATITANISGESKTAACTVTVNDMSDVISASNLYQLLNDSTEEVRVGVGNKSLYDMTINRVAIYSTKNVLIMDQTLSGGSTIVISPPTLVVNQEFSAGSGNLHIFEPGDTTGVVAWKALLYFDFNKKKYKMSVVKGDNSFSVQ